MKIARPDYGFQYGTDPVMPAGALGVGASGEVRVGDGVTVFSALPVLGAGTIPVINALSDIPYGTDAGELFAVKGSAGSPVLYRKNLAKDPKATSTSSFLGTPAAGGLTTITSWRSTAVRFTRSATGAARFNYAAQSLALSTVHSIRFALQCSTAINLTVLYRPAGTTNSTGQAVFANGLAVPAGESDIELENVTLTSQANSGGSFAFTWSEGAVSQTVDITDVQIEQSDTVGAFFYGGTTDAAPYAYDWDGTVNASSSTATRTPFALSLHAA